MKRILVTGASTGIGNAIAKKLLANNFAVLGTSRESNEIDICHKNFSSIDLDLKLFNHDSDTISTFVEDCHEIDSLVLNAGQGRFGGLEEFSPEQIAQQIQINLVAQICLVRAFIKSFKQRGFGDIVFIGSESALIGGKMGSLYSAAKFGLRGFSQALRQECSTSNVRVGLINPGMVESSFFDELSFKPGADFENKIQPEQIADVVIMMLKSDRNVVFDEINISPLKKVIEKKKKIKKPDK